MSDQASTATKRISVVITVRANVDPTKAVDLHEHIGEVVEFYCGDDFHMTYENGS